VDIISFCFRSFKASPNMRNTIPSTRRKNICRPNTIQQNVFNDKTERNEASNGMPKMSIVIIAAMTIMIVVNLESAYSEGTIIVVVLPSDDSKAIIMVKALSEIIGSVIEDDNNISKKVLVSLSRTGAKTQILARPGQTEPEINIRTKSNSWPEVFFISSNDIICFLFHPSHNNVYMDRYKTPNTAIFAV